MDQDPIYAEKKTAQVYAQRVNEFTARYESISFEAVHSAIADLISQKPGYILDVGCGSGRDAAWFARHNWEVFAIDESDAMLQCAQQLHPETNIRWLCDALPALERTHKVGVSFDLILVNAVWMHIHPSHRARAFRKLSSLLRPGGMLIISFRNKEFDDGREFYPSDQLEMEQLAQQFCLAVKRKLVSADGLARSEVEWNTFVFQLPDDGTEALPLLRHIILNDDKSSTYKLALLRTLVKIAESARGLAKPADDDSIEVPLGLVALYWLRLYKPLLEASIRQAPVNRDGRGLGFVKEGFKGIRSVSSFELRPGARFSEELALSLHAALKDARDTITRMPAYYITYPNSSDQVFRTRREKPLYVGTSRLTVNAEYLWSFGSLKMPEHIWLAMCRFGSWIEPSVCNEWQRLMHEFSNAAGKPIDQATIATRLAWQDPERDTRIVRTIIAKMHDEGAPLFCVWSGKKLLPTLLDVDHCFPFSSWPCGDLWNLMPVQSALNQHNKREKLVSSELLATAEDRILSWWHEAYLSHHGYAEQFSLEAASALPVEVENSGLADTKSLFEALQIKRAQLKRDLQIPEWKYG